MAQGMTQQAVADLTGMERADISRVESALKRDIRLTTIVRIAMALDVSMDYLVGFQEEFGICKKNL